MAQTEQQIPQHLSGFLPELLQNKLWRVLDTWWHRLFYELGDERITRWPMMDDPLPLIAILAVWFFFVTSLGPKLMEKRKPFVLQKTLVVYNFLQVILSAWIVIRSIHLYTYRYSLFRCEDISHGTDEESMQIAWGFYVYHVAKITELLDTVFFVMRKKFNQVSFLHLYHHAGMPVMTWGATKYFPGGHAAFIGFINSLVHVVMYFYYMLAAMGPGIQKYLWWKKWITIMQLVQFFLGALHFTQVLFTDTCNYPKWSIVIVIPNAIFFFYLFSDFYRKAYKTSKKSKKFE